MLEKVPEILMRSEEEERRILAQENAEAIHKKKEQLKSELEFKRLQVLFIEHRRWGPLIISGRNSVMGILDRTSGS